MANLRTPIALAALAAAALSCYAVETVSWSVNDRADVEKGKIDKLSLRSDGRLTLAPAVREIFDSSSPYIWAIAADSKGILYAGGGGPGGANAKLFAIEPGGKAKTLAEFDALEVHAIAVDRRDRVYAATSPDGKVFRVTAGGRPELFYDPKAKYIWALVFDSRGDLYVATGDQGEIHRVTPDGRGAVFFKTEETHARSLAVDGQDDLIVGTEPSGLVLRVSPAGAGFVLYQSPKREVTSVAVSPDGSIWAAALGNKTPGTLAPAPTPTQGQPPPPASGEAAAQRPASAGARPGTAAPPSLGSAAVAISGGTEVYRIERDGSPRKVWSQPADIGYAIGFDAENRPLIGTGNKGAIYRLDSDHAWTLLVSAAPTQITGFAAGPRGSIYAVTGNIGKVYRVGPELEREGSIDSESYDAGTFTYWGRLAYKGELNRGTIALETRSGNLDRPQKNWSPWTALAPIAGAGDGGRIVSPPARFVQWKAVLRAAPDGRSPQLDGVDVAYQQKNLAPVVEQVEATPLNYKFPQPTLNITPAQTLSLPPIGQHRRNPSSSVSIDTGQTLTYGKGQAGARWSASDPNGDTLVYKLEIRGVKETAWKPLKDKLKDKFHSWDSTAFPDGEYQVRVTASDAPSNTPAGALTASLESDPFLIDNTPPVISDLAGSANGNRITLRWKAKDELSSLGKAEYSVNGGDWTVVEPTTRLTDSPEHEYALEIDRPAPGEVTVAVRVSDENDNLVTAKVVVK